MVNKFGRAIDHLVQNGDLNIVLESLQAVEDLFTSQWLDNAGEHRLQLLWSRKDALATSELFALGQAIKRLSTHQRTWLETTAKEIKKNVQTSHGLITEIIIIGSLSTKNGVVNPCGKSYPTYDYTVDFDNGYRYKVSIKNFDMSVHEKNFRAMSDTIRKTFRNYLNSRSQSGSLRICCDNSCLTKQMVSRICEFIVFKMNSFGLYKFEDIGVMITYAEVGMYESSQLAKPSDIVMFMFRQHPNEQRNIESKIKSANDSMLKDGVDEKSIKKLIIRLGDTTDIGNVKRYLEQIADDHERCGFEMCIVLQPMVVNDNTSTSITTRFCPIDRSFIPLSERFQEKIENTGLLNFTIGVGSMTYEHAPLTLMEGKKKVNVDLSKYYIYQRGDIYLHPQKNKNGYYMGLASEAPGIIVHSVLSDMVFTPTVYTYDQKLLIL